MTKLHSQFLLAALVILSVTPVLADDVDSNTVRVGLYSVFYHSSADDLKGPMYPRASI